MTTQIQPPPLDIQSYHVDEFVLRALDEFDDERNSSGRIDVDYDVERFTDDPHAYRIVMRIKVGDHATEENAPYSIELTITGHFIFVEGTPIDVMRKMIYINGTSILFGIARGFVGQATGASRNGPFLLPAVNFIELLKVRTQLASGENQQGEPMAQIQAPAEITEV